MFCAECGAWNTEGASFCMSCGHTLPAAPTPLAVPVSPHATAPMHEPETGPAERRGFPVKALLIGAAAAVAVAIVVMVVLLVLNSPGEKKVVTVVASPTPTPRIVTVVVTPLPPGETAELLPPMPAPTGIPPAATSTLAPPAAEPTSAPPTATPTSAPPTPTSGPQIIPASQAPITVDGFECRVLQVAYDDAIFGTVPLTMGGSDQILFVEFELITGENEAFASLMPVLVLESGTRQGPAAWISDQNVHVLTAVTYTGTPSEFSPGESSVALAYVVPQSPGTLLLEFPSGVSIDLTPLMP